MKLRQELERVDGRAPQKSRSEPDNLIVGKKVAHSDIAGLLSLGVLAFERFVAELRLLPDSVQMPKVKPQKRNSAQADAMAKTKAAHSIFKMNTDIGQHVLKNPGIAEQ